MHSLLTTIFAMALIFNPELLIFSCIVMNSLSFYSCHALCCADVQHVFAWNTEYFRAHHMHINHYPCRSFPLLVVLGDRTRGH